MKKVILCSLIVVTISTFHFTEEAEAVSYNSEIGLTFNSDIEAASEDSTNLSSSDSSSSSISNSTSSDSSSSLADTRTSSDQTNQLPETGGNKPSKSGITSSLPSTGSKNGDLLLLLGSFIVIISLIVFSFKAYNGLKKDRKAK